MIIFFMFDERKSNQDHIAHNKQIKIQIFTYFDTLFTNSKKIIQYGISLIILNLGMYLGVPSVVIVGIRKIK